MAALQRAVATVKRHGKYLAKPVVVTAILANN
jgi:hypothetical protein